MRARDGKIFPPVTWLADAVHRLTDAQTCKYHRHTETLRENVASIVSLSPSSLTRQFFISFSLRLEALTFGDKIESPHLCHFIPNFCQQHMRRLYNCLWCQLEGAKIKVLRVTCHLVLFLASTEINLCHRQATKYHTISLFLSLVSCLSLARWSQLLLSPSLAKTTLFDARVDLFVPWHSLYSIK